MSKKEHKPESFYGKWELRSWSRVHEKRSSGSGAVSFCDGCPGCHLHQYTGTRSWHRHCNNYATRTTTVRRGAEVKHTLQIIQRFIITRKQSFEPELEPNRFWMSGAGSKKNLWWSRSLKFGFRFHRHILWSKRVVPLLQWFLVFNGPNRSGAGAKKF